MSWNLPWGCTMRDISGPDGQCEACGCTFDGSDINERGLCEDCGEEYSQACRAELARIKSEVEKLPREQMITMINSTWLDAKAENDTTEVLIETILDGWIEKSDDLEHLQKLQFTAKEAACG